ncbi:MAG TPA: enoyl-CoA hydratase/isomerase family protein [Acidimicrobiia bacterium]|nr:enoyl-CoA hydratase/isomerase family protein [Acidimicrobiia bacterium]
MGEPTYETLRFERRERVGWLRLHRPDKLNAFTPTMWRELGELGRRVGDDEDLRAVVVIGDGRAFSSGIDTSVFTDGTGADTIVEDRPARHADPSVAGILAIQDTFTWLETAPYVTIAAAHGYAFGAGLQLALACDLRVLGRGTKLGLLELQYGILPDLGGTQRLPRLVGPSKALQLIVTGARIDAEEASRLGLADVLVDDDAVEGTAGALAEKIAAQPPLAVRGAKRAVHAAVSGCSVADGLLVEAEGQAACLRSADMTEAIAAFVEQRPPVYKGA